MQRVTFSMRMAGALLGAWLGASAVTPAGAATGGPDAAGYSWRDAVSGCPVVTDTFEQGESATIGPLWTYGPIDIGFPFPFEGRIVRQAWVHKNGLLIFEPPVDDERWRPQPLPTPGDGLTGFVSGFWDQLSIVSPGLWWSRDLAAGTFKLSFRAEWFRSGAPVELEYYLSRDGSIRVETLQIGDGGSTATIGLESFDELSGLEVWRNGTGANGFRLGTPRPGSICYQRAAGLSCATALPLSCGSVNGTLPAGAGSVSAYACGSGFDAAESAYRIDLATASDLTVRLTPSGGRQQAVFLVSACTEWACLAGGTLEASAAALGPGTYYIVVDGRSSADAGAFTLDVACAGFADPIACGETQSGTTVSGATLGAAYGCLPGDWSGPEAYFEIDHPGAPLPLDLSLEAGSSLAVLVFPSGQPPGPSLCLGGGVGGVILRSLPAGRYLVGIESPAGPGSDFVLHAACAPELSCGGAPIATCNAEIASSTAGLANAADFYACTPGRYPGPESVFTLTNPVDQVVSLLLDDAADATLDLFLLSGCDEGACLQAGDRQISSWLPAGSYVVVVDGANAGGAPFRLLPACGLGLEPARVDLAGPPGACFGETKTGWLTPTIPKADILFNIDLSLSMSGELFQARNQIAQVMDWIALHVQDPAFALSTVVDYVTFEYAPAPCESFGEMYGQAGDYPYRLEQPMTTSRPSVVTAMNRLFTRDGFDDPECYTRGLHEAHADPAVAWRPGSRRIVVMFGDSLPHDCNALECLGLVTLSPTGIDFGRDELANTADDLVFLDEIQALVDASTTLVFVSSTFEQEYAEDVTLHPITDAWDCAARRTGGGAVQVNEDGSTLDGRPLAEVIGPHVRDAASRCARLELAAEPGYEGWLADAGVVHSDVLLPAVETWRISICIPPTATPGPHQFEVRMLCDGQVMASQVVHVDVIDGCVPVVTRPLQDAAICRGESALLDGSGITLAGCPDQVRAWRQGTTTLGADPTLLVAPAMTTTYEMELTCPSDPACTALHRATVTVDQPPLLGAVTATDPSACSRGIDLAWAAADFGGGAGTYAVYRSTVDCADAVARPPVMTGLVRPGWFDASPPVGASALHYVVEAEGSGLAGACPAGASHGGPSARACAAPLRDEGTEAFPDGVYATLRARHVGDEVTLTWQGARALVGAEHFHLLKASDDPRSAFFHVNGEGDLSRQHVETDVTSRLQFFDLRVANGCEDLSLDEFPPGYDGR